MKKMLLFVVILSLSFAFSSSYIPEGPLHNSIPDSETLDMLSQGRAEFYIDDMIFNTEKVARNGFTGARWTDGLVYYVFDENVSAEKRTWWLAAAQTWSDVALVTFIKRKNLEPNYIYIMSSTHNSSSLGMVGGSQTLNILDWDRKFVIAHEIGHALGMVHEHSRSDRDVYVTIHFENICQNCCSGHPCNSNFELSPHSVNYGPYDFKSVMHYDAKAFSYNNVAKTITANPDYAEFEDDMGQRFRLSTLDITGMMERYGCREDVALQSYPEGQYEYCESDGRMSFYITPVYGTGPFTYEWHFNDQLIPGETNSWLYIPLERANGGFYDCRVSNACSSFRTPPFSLYINAFYDNLPYWRHGYSLQYLVEEVNNDCN